MQKKSKSNFIEPRLFLVALTILLIFIVLFYSITSMIISVGYQTAANGNSEQVLKKEVLTIILDAGHGGEDPGAIDHNVVEKDINLSIVLKLAKLFKLSGYRVVLTRCEDRMMYNGGEEDRKKYYDLYNRLKYAQNQNNAIFISVHMNKFPLEECRGLQTFYSTNHTSNQRLATIIQSSALALMPDNQRQPKLDKGSLFLLKNLKCPAVLIECGFLSNAGEAAKLSEDTYQTKLALTIYFGLCQFAEELKNENQLCMQ